MKRNSLDYETLEITNILWCRLDLRPWCRFAFSVAKKHNFWRMLVEASATPFAHSREVKWTFRRIKDIHGVLAFIKVAFDVERN